MGGRKYKCSNCKRPFVDIGDDHWVECPWCQFQTGHTVIEEIEITCLKDLDKKLIASLKTTMKDREEWICQLIKARDKLKAKAIQWEKVALNWKAVVYQRNKQLKELTDQLAKPKPKSYAEWNSRFDIVDAELYLQSESAVFAFMDIKDEFLRMSCDNPTH